MKCELTYDTHGWEFAIEPETEIEKCALNFLADKPLDRVVVRNTRLGVFKRTKEDKG